MNPVEERIPLVEERLHVSTRAVETGRVRVRTVVDEHTEYARADLFREAVQIEHVPIDREVTAVPIVREEGDTLVFPVVEEVLVIEKRLFLKEEVRITRTRSAEAFEQPVTVRSTRAVVDRLTPNEDSKENTP